MSKKPLLSAPPFLRRRASLGLVAATALALLVSPPTAAGSAPSGELVHGAGGHGTAAARAVARDFDISVADARARLAQERADDVVADRLTRTIGATHSGGAYIARSGDLVVTVTDRATARQVRTAGATPRLVRFSTRALNRAQDALDRYATTHDAGSIQGWYVDVRTNKVVVTASTGVQSKASRQFLRKARSFGDRVVVQRATGVARPAAYLYGGQQVNMSNGFVCSLGFNARTSSGAYVFVTAGHCAEGFPTFSRNGVTLGGTRNYSFPGNDYAAVNINNPSYWNPQGAVDMYNGFARVVRGYSQAPVGSSLCKSGRTTGWTCGTIQAYNQTVNYGGGDIVSGLVRHSACVEQGDSGGSNMSGNYAQGVSSGGQLYWNGSRYVCGAKVGQPNVSFYQPIGEALSAYGLSLVTG
jgi:streptogrisin C